MFYALSILIPFACICIKNYFSWILRISKHKEKYDFKSRYNKMYKLALSILKCGHLDLHVSGLEKLDKNKTYCFFSNHQAAYDPVGYYAAIADIPFATVAKAEAKKIPIVGKILYDIDGQFLERKDLKQSFRVMMEVEKSLKENKSSWLIFPEGTRNKDNKQIIQEFHHGTFRPAVKAQVDLVPCCIFGSIRVFQFTLPFKKKPIYIKFLDPIPYEEYKDMTTEEIAKMVRSRIQKDLTWNARKFDHEYNLKNNKKHYNLNAN